MALPAPNPDRTCLVTGASSGIGAEIAGLLAFTLDAPKPGEAQGGAQLE